MCGVYMRRCVVSVCGVCDVCGVCICEHLDVNKVIPSQKVTGVSSLGQFLRWSYTEHASPSKHRRQRVTRQLSDTATSSSPLYAFNTPHPLN